jgi:magnesium chelatase family protein
MRCRDWVSPRGPMIVLKVPRILADLDGSESIEPKHLCEGLQYRTLDRSHWA